MLVTLQAGGRSGKHPYPRPREEFAFLLQGEVTLTLGPETHILEEGDAVMILARELRLWVNKGASAARILVVSSRVEGDVKTGGSSGAPPRT